MKLIQKAQLNTLNQMIVENLELSEEQKQLRTELVSLQQRNNFTLFYYNY
jgi:hypothetical protein